MTPFVRAHALVKRFPAQLDALGRARSWVHAVEDVSLEIARGTTLAVAGESGCGKSTLGRLLLGLVPPTRGRVFLEADEVTAARGRALRLLRKRMQMIFQDPYGSLDPRMSIGEAVREALDIHAPSLAKLEKRARVEALLARVGLRPDQVDARPHAFSGGQRQRVVIARALAVDPELVVADEPVSALDVSIQAQIVDLLAALQAERGLTYLFVSHDLKVVEQITAGQGHEIAVLYMGRVVERGPAPSVFARARHPYTQALLSAVPDPRPHKRKPRILLEGDVPSPIDPPTGCAFHPRCPLAKRLDVARRERCARELPALRVIDGVSCACHFAEEL